MKIVSGEMYYYYDAACAGIQMHIFLDEPVNGQILQQAVKRTEKVHPYLTWTVREKDGDFYYHETGAEMMVIHGENYPVLGNKDCNGQLAAVTYWENGICLVFYHGLMDGVAARRVLETLTYFYFSIKDGKEYDKDGIMTEAADTYPTLFAEPYAQKYETDLKTEQVLQQENSSMPNDLFSLVGKKENIGKENVIQILRVPSAQFMNYSKTNKTSPSIAFAILLCQSIQKLYPENKKYIRINIPISLRDALGLPDTFRNTTGDVALFMDPSWLKEMKTEELGAKLRAELKEKMNPERLKCVANQAMDFLSMTGKYKTFNERFELYKTLPPPVADTIFISYMGRLNTSGYSDHIKGCDVASMPREGFVFNIYDCGGFFNIVLTKNGTDRLCADAFISVCEENGMEATLAYQRSYHLEYVAIRETLGLKK